VLVPQCRGFKRDGTQCSASVILGVEYCYNHDPVYAGDRKRAASKAGKSSRSNSEIREIKGLLRDLYSAVLEGRVEPKAATVAGQVANTQLRAIELERRMREQDELEGRLDELEDLLAEAEERTYAGR
jgi:hypothetical protein